MQNKIKGVHLARHDFPIDTTNVDAGIKTSFIVSINDVTTKRLVGANRTVVWTLEYELN